MLGQPIQTNKGSYLELRPIKIELGGLTMANTFSRLSAFPDYEEESDEEDLEEWDQQNEEQVGGGDSRQQRFEPEPEDDNYIAAGKLARKSLAGGEKQKIQMSIFQEDWESQSNEGNKNGQEQNMLTQVVEDSRLTRFLFQKLQVLQTSQLIFATMTMILSVIEVCYDIVMKYSLIFILFLKQYDIRMRQLEVVEGLQDFLLVTISIGTIILSKLIFITFKQMRTHHIYTNAFNLTFKKAQKIMGKDETIWSSKSAYLFLLEILILIPHPNIVTRNKIVVAQQTVEDISIPYEVNDFFDIWILVRTYIVFRCILNQTIYGSTRAKRICRMIGCDSEEPLVAVPAIFFIGVLLFGHALRIAEMPLFTLIEGNSQNFGNYINCFWCVIITMATVGYGDYYPKSLPGRMVIVLAAIVGVVLISILVVALNVNLEMSIAEKKTNHVIKRLNARKSLMESSANVITKAAKLKIMMDKGELKSHKQQRDKLNAVKKDISEFRMKNRKIKNMYDNSSQSEEMTRQFDFLKQELKEIYENQNKLRDYLLKIKTNLNQNEFEEPSLPSISDGVIQE